MACCHKEYAEKCEILVCVDAPAPLNLNFYSRLRFGLLASSWLPRPLGIFLWSALHVLLLIVGGPVFWVLGLLTAFLFSVTMFSIFGIIVYFRGFVFSGLIAVAVDLALLFGRSIRFCWSLVGFLTCHQPIVEWRGGAYRTVLVWKEFKPVMNTFWDFVSIGVPYASNSLYKATKDRQLKTWARWFQEVVHMHEVITL